MSRGTRRPAASTAQINSLSRAAGSATLGLFEALRKIEPYFAGLTSAIRIRIAANSHAASPAKNHRRNGR